MPTSQIRNFLERRRKPSVAAALAVVGIVAVAGFNGGGKASEPTHVITGDITVPDINGALITQVGGYAGQPLDELGFGQLNKMGRLIKSLQQGKTYPCPDGSGGGFSDIVVGGQVIVEDGNGDVLATSSLTGGKVNTNGCTFTYRVEVSDSDFYKISVTNRGWLTYSRSDMASQDWHVSSRL